MTERIFEFILGTAITALLGTSIWVFNKILDIEKKAAENTAQIEKDRAVNEEKEKLHDRMMDEVIDRLNKLHDLQMIFEKRRRNGE